MAKLQMLNAETGEIIDNNHPFIRTPYNYDRDAASLETATVCTEETLAQQQFKDECDINTILERFGITGELPQNLRQPLSADFIEAYDYKTAMDSIIEAQNAFMELPAKIREEFNNDPGQFIQFFEQEENRARAIELGLIQAPREPANQAPADPTPPTT
ncbi:internal scaffolding protein [Apis mellifera associated microvirus 13]|nr:internal scaffolding protein [Apis mellifera associated microvirus 13]